tara:strand:+ start:2234 stop:2983 length:750 start_codon:yes stop_codon:yes gene_type:complete
MEDNIFNKIKITSIASIIEVLGGHPIDRWKVNSQMRSKDRLTFKTLLLSGRKNLYAGLRTALYYNSIFYFPAIYALDHVWKADNIGKTIFVSFMITPIVSCFEGIKTDQQVNKLHDKDMLYIMKKRYSEYGVRGLMPSFYSTFYREFCYCSGLLLLSPFIASKINTGKDYIDRFVGGGLAGLVSQSMSQPFDSIKTRQEKYKTGFIETIKIINKEGKTNYWNGGLGRCIRGVWSISCMSVMCNSLSKII